MKKTVCSVLLCLALSLLCGTALADDLEVKVQPVDESAVQIERTEKNGDLTFTVTRSSGAEAGQLYLALIMSGSDPEAKPVPTKDNVYYLDVAAAVGSSISFEAYPRDLDAGTYVVYLSDWSAGNDGKALGVGTITVSAGTAILYGDVNGDGNVLRNDRIILTRYLANKDDPEVGPGKRFNVVEANADVNGDGAVLRNDRIILTRHLAGAAGYETLPYSAK